jgi:hypothetical protein
MQGQRVPSVKQQEGFWILHGQAFYRSQHSLSLRMAITYFASDSGSLIFVYGKSRRQVSFLLTQANCFCLQTFHFNYAYRYPRAQYADQ